MRTAAEFELSSAANSPTPNSNGPSRHFHLHETSQRQESTTQLEWLNGLTTSVSVISSFQRQGLRPKQLRLQRLNSPQQLASAGFRPRAASQIEVGTVAAMRARLGPLLPQAEAAAKKEFMERP